MLVQYILYMCQSCESGVVLGMVTYAGNPTIQSIQLLKYEDVLDAS